MWNPVQTIIDGAWRPRGDVFLFGDGLRLSPGAVDAAADNFAWRLHDAGLRPGDAAMWVGGAGVDRAVMALGALRAGVVYAMADMRHPDERLTEMAHAADAKALIVAEDHRVRLSGMGWRGLVVAGPAPGATPPPRPRFPAVTADQAPVAFIAFTSGSTGAPKAVRKTRAHADYFQRMVVDLSGMGPADTVGLLGNAWQTAILPPFAVGARIGCYDVGGKGAAGLVDWLVEARVTLLMIYPAIYRQIVAAGRPLPDLRYVMLIGEPVTRADAEAFNAVAPPGAVLANILGNMELSFLFNFEYRAGDPIEFEVMPLGAPTDDLIVKVVDENGRTPPVGAEGEVVMIADHMPTEYLDNAAATERSIRPLPDGALAFHTGDLAWRDYRGVHHTAGRRDFRTKIRGYTIDLAEVEAIIGALPQVDEVAVVAADGPYRQRRLVCCLVGAATPKAIRAAMAPRVANYMIPSVWRRMSALPRTATGKVDRTALSAPVDAAAPPADFSAASATERAVAGAFASVLGRDGFGRDDDFFDLGGDSLQAMTLELELERRFGRRAPPDAMMLNGASVAAVAALLETSREQVEVMRPGADGGPTLALAHLMGGRLADYLAMVHAFDRRTRVLGLRARGMDGGGGDASYRRMAHHAVLQLEEAGVSRGDAGLTVLGYSFGAPLALEIARVLAADGAAPAVVMLDPWAPWTDPKRWLRPTAAALRAGAPMAAMADALRAAGGMAGLAPGGVDAAHRAAWLRYRPAPLPGLRGLLIHTRAPEAVRAAAAWRAALGEGLTLRDGPGDHVSMMKEPLAGPLAQVVQGWMAEGALA